MNYCQCFVVNIESVTLHNSIRILVVFLLFAFKIVCLLFKLSATPLEQTCHPFLGYTTIGYNPAVENRCCISLVSHPHPADTGGLSVVLTTNSVHWRMRPINQLMCAQTKVKMDFYETNSGSRVLVIQIAFVFLLENNLHFV